MSHEEKQKFLYYGPHNRIMEHIHRHKCGLQPHEIRLFSRMRSNLQHGVWSSSESHFFREPFLLSIPKVHSFEVHQLQWFIYKVEVWVFTFYLILKVLILDSINCGTSEKHFISLRQRLLLYCTTSLTPNCIINFPTQLIVRCHVSIPTISVFNLLSHRTDTSSGSARIQLSSTID